MNYNYIGPGPSISKRQNSCTPSLSLIYDFNNSEDKDTAELHKSFDGSEGDLSQFSEFSYVTMGSEEDLEVRLHLNGSQMPSPQLSPPLIHPPVKKEHRSVSLVASHLRTTTQQQNSPMTLFPSAAAMGSSQSVPSDYA